MSDFLTKLFLKSQGLKRTIASVLTVAGQVAHAVPVLQPYAATVDTVAAVFAAWGVGHAVVSNGGSPFQP